MPFVKRLSVPAPFAATVDINMGVARAPIKSDNPFEPGPCPARMEITDAGWDCMNSSNEMDEAEVLRIKLEMLRREHRDLDEAIAALQERGAADMLTIKRLKKQKLALKDRIAVLEDRIHPDIIA